jgi:DNA-binding MarR family transcriptional regulator
LAEELSFDLSWASRIAADLITGGYLRREADQSDGRRSVLRLTDDARSALRALRERKWEKLAGVFADWADDDIEAFARLFDHYRVGMARACEGSP